MSGLIEEVEFEKFWQCEKRVGKKEEGNCAGRERSNENWAEFSG